MSDRRFRASAADGWPLLDLTGPMKQASRGWGAEPYLTYSCIIPTRAATCGSSAIGGSARTWSR